MKPYQNHEPYIKIRDEMQMIKDRQQMLAVDESVGVDREMWKLQIVWEYLKERFKEEIEYNEYDELRSVKHLN